ncbi:hypothetical protein KMP13_18440 [Epibacterium ulvae]|uniref:hypothetical protein n=1 Tax=Epibacterium ulvae TaxID=1156985 RepID=UPI001BFC8293|nr:hypothetical protein [Epibacterium ulvae]MBT8155804.1 hypothetical protein [Epibacterium ulvae]
MAQPFPVAVTAYLSICNCDHAALPVVFSQDPELGECNVCMDIVKWASQLSANLGTISVRQHVAAVCRFMNFYHLYSQGQKLSVQDQTMSVFAYMDFRGTGTKHLNSDHLLHALDWDGVAKTTVSSEFKFLESYAGSDARTLDRRLFRLPMSEVKNLRDQTDDFFIHLAKHRHFWADLRGDDNIRTPKRFRPTSRQKGFRPFPPEEEIRLIIAAESNSVFRAIWILLTYGASHRISEVLNIWQVGILPSSYNREFFGIPADDLPLVLIAHPNESTWLGDFNTNKMTRMEYLLNKYGFQPRPDRSSSDVLYAGFKTKKLFGDYLIAKTWWLNEGAALAFNECVNEIQAFHLRHRTSRKHPYFFINMFARDGRLGEPLTMKRVSKAWADACKRVGITPHVRGRNLHGLRHFTKFYMDELRLSASSIQTMRGDHSIISQDEYGQCATKVNQALTNMKH